MWISLQFPWPKNHWLGQCLLSGWSTCGLCSYLQSILPLSSLLSLSVAPPYIHFPVEIFIQVDPDRSQRQTKGPRGWAVAPWQMQGAHPCPHPSSQWRMQTSIPPKPTQGGNALPSLLRGPGDAPTARVHHMCWWAWMGQRGSPLLACTCQHSWWAGKGGGGLSPILSMQLTDKSKWVRPLASASHTVSVWLGVDGFRLPGRMRGCEHWRQEASQRQEWKTRPVCCVCCACSCMCENLPANVKVWPHMPRSLRHSVWWRDWGTGQNNMLYRRLTRHMLSEMKRGRSQREGNWADLQIYKDNSLIYISCLSLKTACWFLISGFGKEYMIQIPHLVASMVHSLALNFARACHVASRLLMQVSYECVFEDHMWPTY